MLSTGGLFQLIAHGNQDYISHGCNIQRDIIYGLSNKSKHKKLILKRRIKKKLKKKNNNK
jgi:hypothetical protein